jgi:AraC-like DNA-binding protein
MTSTDRGVDRAQGEAAIMHHVEPRTIVPSLQSWLVFDQTGHSSSAVPVELDDPDPTPYDVRVAISHSSAVAAAALAALIRQRTTWDVLVLGKSDGAPWDDLIGKHVVVLDEQTAQRAMRANREFASRRLPWTRLVLMSDRAVRTAVDHEPSRMDAMIRPDCSAAALVSALEPLLAELHGGDERDARPGNMPANRSAFAQPRPRACGARGPRGGLTPHALRRVREYVLAHVDERIEVEQLAVIARLSSCHFARAFRQSMGVPPHRYVLIRRIHVGAELVRDTDRSVADIAAAVGFSDQSHFTRTFVRITGDTPSAFRRRHR